MFTPKRLLVLVLLLIGGIGFWQRTTALAWWHVRRLAHCNSAEQSAALENVMGCDAAAVPWMLSTLHWADGKVANHIEDGLAQLIMRWGMDDPRCVELLERIHADFPNWTLAGKAAGLRTVSVLLSQEAEVLPACITSTAGEILKSAEPRPELRAQQLQLAAALLDHVPPGQWRDSGRELALAGLADNDPAVRIAALRLMLGAALRDDRELLARGVPLLRDSAVDVRRAAVVGLGAREDLVSEDDLLPLLHDEELEVQQLCELALRGRGLQEHHLRMARLISDDRPSARLQVLRHLRSAGDLDTSIWLQKLSQDPSPAVRAAAVRAAAEQPKVELRQQLFEQHRQDASPTVRELAHHYLSR